MPKKTVRRVRTTITLNLPTDQAVSDLLDRSPVVSDLLVYLLRREARGELTARETLESLRLQALIYESDYTNRIADYQNIINNKFGGQR